MGCGCGGNRKNVNARIRPAQPPALRPATRQVQTQAANRQALVQQARQNSVSAMAADKTEAERKKKIQVSLRNRNLKRP
jgi:hypothetical protein